ncbi:MAG: TAT-variant-translocated molybdopterin oxidoreductase [Planctomycetota bacterium]
MSETISETLYWRSPEQLQHTRGLDEVAMQEYLQREFPDGIENAPDDVSRRGFLSAIAASVALAGLTSCRKPKTHILPFNKRPEGFNPGSPHFYATTLVRSGYGVGVLVKSSDGRPTKIEGNPEHPSSLGGSDARLQAELLQIYDPGRSRAAVGPHAADAAHADDGHGHGDAAHGEHAAAADPNQVYYDFYAFWEETSKQLRMTNQGAGLHVLMPPTTSPSLLAMIGKVKSEFPEARFHYWEPIHRDEVTAGAVAAFTAPVETSVDFGKARVVASFDCDFLGLDGNSLRSARDWGRARRAPAPGAPMSRLYMFESCYSTTGTAADHRFRMKPQDVTAAVLQLAAELGVGQGNDLGAALAAHKKPSTWAAALAKDLRAAGGNCAVVVGPRMPAMAHAAAHAIHEALGCVGKTVTHTPLPESLRKRGVDSLRELKAAIESKQVQVLACLGANPAYDAPADLGLAKLLHDGAVPHLIHLGLYRDETAASAHWHLPLAHELESWGDARAHDGTISLQQPLIEPLFGGVSPLEFLAFLGQQPNYELLTAQRDGSYGLELLREHWSENAGAAAFESWWTNALHDGRIADTQLAAETVTLVPASVATAVRAFQPVAGTEVQLRPCPKMWDGRYANNSWMQELPDPLTKLCWDNAALLSMATARQLGVENGDMLAIRAGTASVQIPAWVLPGHADDAVTIYLGWGRELGDDCKVARGAGFDAYPLRTTGAQWLLTGVQVAKGTGHHKLVCTQEHGTMAGRAIVREATAETHRQKPDWAPRMSPLDQAARLKDKTEADINKSLWQERGYLAGAESRDLEVARSPYQWGMVIDLNSCTGCSACVVACVAENNIPMVGKKQVATNREMFWIRADRYFASQPGDDMEVADDPQVANMPVPCMQCENAPCESVCPVAATMHSPDGLNDMVYNRCIGTRYCSNNCPYKVRRFNYFNYTGKAPETKQMAFNPDVTVRSRGVMEKCTYCVQRINGGRIAAKLSGKRVGDGQDDVHVTTACAQACPTEAITFGNIIDTSSKVAQLRQNSLNYGLLSELNTKPRTTYLGRVRNPNPDLVRQG